MTKERIVLELMRELGLKTKDLLFAEKAFNENGELSLEVHIKGGGSTKDITFFDNNPQSKPDGVIIDQEIFPFCCERCCKQVGFYGGDYLFSSLKKENFPFPNEHQLTKLSKHYTEYKAIARLFGLSYYSKCAYQHPQNCDNWINYFDFENKIFTAHNSAVPFFEVKSL